MVLNRVKNRVKQINIKSNVLAWLLALMPLYPTRTLIHNIEESFLKLWIDR